MDSARLDTGSDRPRGSSRSLDSQRIRACVVDSHPGGSVETHARTVGHVYGCACVPTPHAPETLRGLFRSPQKVHALGGAVPGATEALVVFEPLRTVSRLNFNVIPLRLPQPRATASHMQPRVSVYGAGRYSNCISYRSLIRAGSQWGKVTKRNNGQTRPFEYLNFRALAQVAMRHNDHILRHYITSTPVTSCAGEPSMGHP